MGHAGMLRRDGGFTLIELVVVTVVLGLAAVVVFQVIARVRPLDRQFICLQNLRAHGRAAEVYRAENNDYFARGMQSSFLDYNGDIPVGADDYAIYASAMLGPLGYPGDTISLWLGNSAPGPQRHLRGVLKRQFGLNFQCPAFPENHPDSGPSQYAVTEHQYNDYAASAIPIPYTSRNINRDVSGGGTNSGDPNETSFRGESMTSFDYDSVATPAQIAAAGRPLSELIYVTEAHSSLPWYDYRFHHFFLGSQLPFGAFPRIATDQRHPGGLNALFFDGHAETMPLDVIDPGWPEPLDVRLRWFTVVPNP